MGRQSSDEVVLVVRPEDVQIVDEPQSLLSGTVLETQFFGGRSTIAVGVRGLSAPVTFTCQGMASVHRGDVVHLSWAPDKGVLLSAPVEPS